MSFVVHQHEEDLLLFVVLRSAEYARRLLPRVPADYFQSRSHARVWRALSQAKARPDVSWYDPHEVRRQLAAVGGRDEDLELLEDAEVSDVPVRQTPTELVARLQYNALRRQLWDDELPRLTTLVGSGAGDAESLYQLLGEIQRAVRPFVGSRVARDSLADFRAWRGREVVKIQLGVPVFDEQFTLGYLGGDQTTIAGPTSVGKTRLVNWIADRFASQGHKPAVFCWEVSRARTIAQYVALRTGFSYERICFDRSDSAFCRAVDEVAEQVTSEIEFFDFQEVAARRNKSPKTASGNLEMLDTVYGMAEDAGVDVAVFDLMAKCLPSQRPDDVEAALDHARVWEARFHALYIHQLSMKKVSGHDVEAELGDSLGGQAWVSVPDNVFFLRRYTETEEEMDAPAEERDVLEKRCAKQRWGPKGWRVIADFVGERGTLENWRAPSDASVSSPSEVRRRPKKSAKRS